MNTEAPVDYNAFQAVLADRVPHLPKRLRQCAEFMQAHPDQIAFARVADVAAGAGVHPSAVMRFAQVLGFSGYSALQRVFRARHAERWPDYSTRLSRLRTDGDASPAGLLGEFAEAGRQSIARLAQQVSLDALEDAVETLARARMLYIAGYRRAFPVAAYLAHAFESQGRPFVLLHEIGMVTPAPAFQAEDAMIAISFEPYTAETVAYAETAAAAGLPVIALSDAGESPLRRMATHYLAVTEAQVGAFRSLAGTVTLASALVTAVGARKMAHGE